MKKTNFEPLTNSNEAKKVKKAPAIVSAVSGIAVVSALLLGTFSVSTVPANHVGVKYSCFSGTSENVLGEGVHLKLPFFENVNMIDLKVQERTDQDVSIQTHDSQFVSMVVNVKYNVDKKNAFKVYKNYGTLEAMQTNIIGNFTQDALNAVCSEYNIIELLGEKRNEAVRKTEDLLRERLEKEGVTLKSVSVKDMDGGEAIEKAISDEAVAKKAVETAKQNQEKAKAEAETKRIKAQGDADANRILAESVTDELIRLKEVQARDKHGWITVQGADSVIANPGK